MNRLDRIVLSARRTPGIADVYRDGPWRVVKVDALPDYFYSGSPEAARLRVAARMAGMAETNFGFFLEGSDAYIVFKDRLPVWAYSPRYNMNERLSGWWLDRRPDKDEQRNEILDVLIKALHGPVGDVDWRPDEMLPEDFYAS